MQPSDPQLTTRADAASRAIAVALDQRAAALVLEQAQTSSAWQQAALDAGVRRRPDTGMVGA